MRNTVNGEPGPIPERFVLASLDEVMADPPLISVWSRQAKHHKVPLAIHADGVSTEEAGAKWRVLMSEVEEGSRFEATAFLLPPSMPETEIASRATGLFTRSRESRQFGSLFRSADAYIHACRHWILTRKQDVTPSCGPPDFIGVGTQRSGTTWWTKLMQEHPEIIFPWKELHFFDQMTDLPIEMYQRLFVKREGQIAGEFTPGYIFWPKVPMLLHRAAPQARLIALLRDPLARYASGLAFARERGTPEAAQDERMHLKRGLYGLQLKRLFRYFPRDQVLVLQYERCVQEPLEEYRRTLEFLGVTDTSFRPEALDRRVNETHVTIEIAEGRRRELEAVYREDAQRLRELVPDIDFSLWPWIEKGAAASAAGPRHA